MSSSQTNFQTRFPKPNDNQFRNSNQFHNTNRSKQQMNKIFQQQPNTLNLYDKSITIKCYWCSQPRHRFNECPQRMIVNIAKEIEVMEKFEEFHEAEEFEGNEIIILADEGEHMNCIIQKGFLPLHNLSILNITACSELGAQLKKNL